MKTDNGRRLKQLVQDAAFQADVNYRRYRDQFDVDELFNEIAGIGDAKMVAAIALNRLCRSERGFNNNAVGLKAVMRFLSEVCSQQPVSDGDVAHCLLDLKETLSAASASADDICEWIDRWYQL
ncbi:MAG TPA: hypothetical protein VFI31_16630 [Pirellulales bacterium]|nr:hypothetical protein [Pirellulales bacterium]